MKISESALINEIQRLQNEVHIQKCVSLALLKLMIKKEMIDEISLKEEVEKLITEDEFEDFSVWENEFITAL